MSQILDTINSPIDLKRLPIPQLAILAEEIRDRIITVVSRTGGHLAPSLGVVELTIALHYVFDTPEDKIIWDVGHQAYTHKLITGRREGFESLRQYRGVSGFCKRSESEYDVFDAGHASTSISSALGIACARDQLGKNFSVVAVIGDGAMTGGLAFEGLNNAGALNKDIIVILNDNEMSISKNVGALSQYLTDLLTNDVYNRIKTDIWELTGKMAKVGKRFRAIAHRVDEGVKSLLTPGMLFETLGFRYFGPIDGHNLTSLIRVLKQIKQLPGPTLLHVLTIKGKGYRFAEEDAPRFHGVGAFEKTTGTANSAGKGLTYDKVFGQTMVKLAERNPRVVSITAAMAIGTGLSDFANRFPDRFYDVGIAEQHAVTFAAGLALQGLRPVVAIYSTFLQRAYDQIIHDVALQCLPVVFALDRAGVVGEDGPTHHGAFDLGYLRQIPNLVVAAPKDENELRHLLYTAVQYQKGPMAIRYPRGSVVGVPLDSRLHTIKIGSWEILREGEEVAILAAGSMVYPSLEAAEIMAREGISPTVVNCRFEKPMDRRMCRELCMSHPRILTVEENSLAGGFGSAILDFIEEEAISFPTIRRVGLPNSFIQQGSRTQLLELVGLSVESLVQSLRKLMSEKRE